MRVGLVRAATGIVVSLAAATALRCGGDRAPSSEGKVSKASQPLVTSCVGAGAGVCPTTTNSTNVSRIFAGGNPGVDDTLLLEDAATHEVYRYASGTAWTRVGTSARSYVIASGSPTAIYRIAGDGRLDKELDDNDDWDRVGIDPVSSVVTASGTLYAVDRLQVLSSYSSNFTWQAIDNTPASSYAANGSSVYRANAAGV